MARGNFATTRNLVGAVSLTAVPVSLACWALPAVVNTSQIAVALQNSGAAANSNNFNLAINSSAEVRARTNGTDAVSTLTATAGVWVHMCAVFAATNSRAAYINGGGKGTDATNVSPSGINSTLVGVGGGTVQRNNPFTGPVCEVGIWNIALSDADVAMLALGYPPPMVRPDALVAYYPLIGRASPETDAWGKIDLTVTGAVSTEPHARIIPLRQPQLLIPPPSAITRLGIGLTRSILLERRRLVA